MKRHLFAALSVLAGVLVLSISSLNMASATTVTFDFDDLVGNENASNTPYSRFGYTFDPLNGNNSSHCYEDGCFLESSNGTPTMLYDDGSDLQTPVYEEFDMLSFYFNFQGDNAGGPNATPCSPTDINDTNCPPTNALALYTENGEGANPTFYLILNASYNVSEFTIYEADDVAGGPFTGNLVKNTGYWIVFNDSMDGIGKFVWEGTESKQTRIDCVTISPDGQNQDVSKLNDCTPGVIPLPSGLPLMASALGLIGILSRRAWKRSA